MAKQFVFSEMVEQLRSEGLTVTADRVRYGIRAGFVDRPKMNGSLQFVFTPKILQQLRRYLAKASRLGRKPKEAAVA